MGGETRPKHTQTLPCCHSHRVFLLGGGCVCVCIQSAYCTVSEFRYNSGMGVALNDLCSATCQSVFKSNEQSEPSTKILHVMDMGF